MNEKLKKYFEKKVISYKEQRLKNARLTIFSILIICMVVTFLSIPAITMQNEADLNLLGKGNLIVATENIFPDNFNMDVRVSFIAGNEHGFKEEYNYQIVDDKGNIRVEDKVIFNEYNSHDGGGYLFEGIESGDTINIQDVDSVKDVNNEELKVSAKVDVNVHSEEYIAKMNDYLFIEADQSKSINILFEKVKLEKSNLQESEEKGDDSFVTTDTFKSIGGEYSLKYILNNYNVFSFNDVEAKHVVGPIVAKNRVYKREKPDTEAKTKEALTVSDISKGISSYIGIVEPLDAILDGKIEPIVKLNYKYDDFYGTATGHEEAPRFYVNNENNRIIYEGTEHWGKYLFKKDQSEIKYDSPNYSAQAKVLKNDEFIDFDEALSEIIIDSKKYLENKNNIIVEPNYSGVLDIEVGKNYIVRNVSKLEKVVIKYPEGYDPLHMIFPYDTIINIADGEKFPTSQNEKYQYFPQIYIKIGNDEEKQFSAICPKDCKLCPEDKNEIDFGRNNNIVWNMPYLQTIDTEEIGKKYMLSRQNGSDILGHIVAPNVEFWSCDDNDWIGGNMNGCAIVKSWHAANIESHMFPLKDPKEITTEVNIKAKKELKSIDDRPILDGEFEFSLNSDESISGGILSGVPQTVKVKNNGDIEFEPITFGKKGEYKLYIKEEIPSNNTNSIIYDKSIYEVRVVISEDSEKKLVSNYEIFKIQDKDGSKLEPPVKVENNTVCFENKEDNNVESNTVNLSFIKVDSEDINKVLKDAEFELVEVEENNDGNLVEIENGFKSIVTSDENGSISFIQIPIGKKYKMTETKVPEGYEKPEGYWIIDIDEGGIIKITPVGDSPQIEEDFKIPNKQYDYTLPETGGSGIISYFFAGLLIMIASAIIYKNKYIN